MRCLLLPIVLLPSALQGQAAAPPVRPSTDPVRHDCATAATRRIGAAGRPHARKLGEMPPAQPIYTVLRQFDGCPVPVKVGTPVRGG